MQPSEKAETRSEDRALGAIVGLAIGDALGAPVEFCRLDTFEPVTGMRAGGYHKHSTRDWPCETALVTCHGGGSITASIWRWQNLPRIELGENAIEWSGADAVPPPIILR